MTPEIFACPIDGSSLDDSLTCEKGHKFSYNNGIYDFINQDYKADKLLESVAPIYEQIWAPFGFFLTSALSYNSLLKKIGSIMSSEVVLDIGTGTGRLFDFTNCKTCIGMDISNKFLYILKQKRSKVIAVHGNAETLPIKSASVDSVSSILVIHMLKNPQVAIKEISRVLKNRGKCAIVVLISNGFISRILSKWWKINPKDDNYYVATIKEFSLKIKEKQIMGPWELFICEKN
ncbi:class I SAM-dependent methyltransferase [Candidatus Acidianus copahuensis]|uniref:class I SAM-dependent methyltransferase n=1 Tax=Candidatus Acidianus copahuensis TaxID=1160895 RepID=UPI00064F5DD1|nr:class I SAM-dependent methyltransferase [Candidatus Acidianus copahuensis]